jgi:hypothetical protein
MLRQSCLQGFKGHQGFAQKFPVAVVSEPQSFFMAKPYFPAAKGHSTDFVIG